jgi:hypothetical protein
LILHASHAALLIYYYYLAGCTMFSHIPSPIDNYIIFFLQLLPSFQSSSINPFLPSDL